MPSQRKVFQIIKGDAPEAAVVEQEAARLDQIDLDPEAGGKPQ
jgi:hypothetical protein